MHLIRNIQGRVVGKIENGVLYKSIKGSKHMLKTPPCIAFDKHIIDMATVMRVESVRVLDKETGITYSAELKKILQHPINIDRGYGKQIGLLITEWETTK